MNAPDPAFSRGIGLTSPEDDHDKPVDMIWILRGGGTDVYTLIKKLDLLQRQLPDDHLSSTSPYIMADSAGAYPAAGLVIPNPVDPTHLPRLFYKNINRYLSRNRAEADAALCEDVGPLRIDQSVLPICISSTEITAGLRKAYFRHFPQEYASSRGLKAPASENANVRIADAVLASSAFAAYLGDYRIEDRRFMDMAFLETHALNLADFAMRHRICCPDRRLVCVVFGNIYSDFRLAQQEALNVKGLNRHFGNAVRTFVQADIVQTAETLLGAHNVFDLSMYVQQPFSAPEREKLPHAFRSDALAIRERMRWTYDRITADPRQLAQIEELGALIKSRALPSVRPDPLLRPPAPAPQDVQPLLQTPLTRTEQLQSLRHDWRVSAGLIGSLISDHVQPYAQRCRPFFKAAASLIAGLASATASYAGQAWQDAKPRLEERGTRTLDFLLSGQRTQRSLKPLVEVMPPSPSRSSEQHMPSGSDRTPL